MTYAVCIIHTDGCVTEFRQPKAPGYEQLRSAVDGPIETVPYFKKYNGHSHGVAYANEEGILRGMEVNAKASELWWQNLDGYGEPYRRTLLHGPVVFYAKVKED